MATGASNPKTTSSGGISPIWLWLLTFVAVAVSWERFPDSHGVIVMIAALMAFILWIRFSGVITSQVSTVTSGKA